MRAGVNQPSYKYNNSPYSNQTSAQSINRPVSGYSSKYTGVTNYDSYMKNSESNPFNGKNFEIIKFNKIFYYELKNCISKISSFDKKTK